jgi:hemerythrin-like domain-containing protein
MAKTLATVHKVITRGVEVTRSRSQSFAEQGLPDEALWSGFISYARTFVNLTHAHHDGEEVLIFPFGQQKMPDTSFDLLIDQHRGIAALLDEMGAAIDQAERNPATESASRISRLAAQVGEIWQTHIGEEETIFGAERVNAVATPEEQAKLMQQAAQHGMSHAGPDYLAAPFILHNLEPDDRAHMAGEMPPILGAGGLEGPVGAHGAVSSSVMRGARAGCAHAAARSAPAAKGQF